MLPIQRDAILTSQDPQEVIDSTRISSVFTAEDFGRMGLLNNNHGKTIKFENIKLYCGDKKLKFMDALRQCQVLAYYYNYEFLPKVYEAGAEMFKKACGISTNVEALYKLAPLDYGEILRNTIYLAYGANESTILGKEATILVKVYDFDRNYTAFSYGIQLSKFKL